MIKFKTYTQISDFVNINYRIECKKNVALVALHLGDAQRD